MTNNTITYCNRYDTQTGFRHNIINWKDHQSSSELRHPAHYSRSVWQYLRPYRLSVNYFERQEQQIPLSSSHLLWIMSTVLRTSHTSQDINLDSSRILERLLRSDSLDLFGSQQKLRTSYRRRIAKTSLKLTMSLSKPYEMRNAVQHVTPLFQYQLLYLFRKIHAELG